MKKLIMIGLALFVNFGFAGTVSLTKDQCDNVKIRLNQAYYTIPAKFPKAASTQEIQAPYVINCPNFKAERTAETLQISSKSWDYINSLLPYNDVFNRTGYKYPTIKEDFYYNYLRIQFSPIKVINENWFGLSTVGYKVNNGDLKPAYFEFQKYPIEYKVGDIIDIYAKDDASFGEQVLARITINTKSPSVKIWTEYPFPEN